MTWAMRFAVASMGLALLRGLLVALGPPRTWPARRRRARAERARVGAPDPFVILHMQHRLGLIATELRVLQADGADETYYARAHRIHTRRSAYDQLLAEACRMAGVRTEHADRPSGLCRNEDERFLAETELAARGWHW